MDVHTIMIEHADLKEAMQFIIDKAYYGSRKEFISIYSNSANWTHSPKQTTTSVTNTELFELICYLIDNIYFRCGERVFRKKLVSQWELIVHLFWQICIFTIMNLNLWKKLVKLITK